MTPTDTTHRSIPPETEERHLSVTLDDELQLILKRLAFWGRGVGIISTIAGGLLVLGIMAFMIPAFIAGIILIFTGSRLLMASSHFRNFQDNPSLQSLSRALHTIRSYIFLNGLLLILFIIFAVAAIIWFVTFGNELWEIWDESIYHFVLTLTFNSA